MAAAALWPPTAAGLTMPPRLVGKVTAWYPEEGRGHICRLVKKLPPVGSIQLRQEETYSFLMEEVSGKIAEGLKVCFYFGGISKLGQWVALRVHQHHEGMADQARGKAAKLLEPCDASELPEVGVGPAAAADLEEQEQEQEARVPASARRQQAKEATVAKQQAAPDEAKFADARRRWEEAPIEDKNMSLEHLESSAAEATAAGNQRRLAHLLGQASAWVEAPELAGDGEAVSSDKATTRKLQAKLRKILVPLLANVDLEGEIVAKKAMMAVPHLRKTILDFERATGSEVGAARGGKRWQEIKAAVLGEAVVQEADGGEDQPEESAPPRKKRKQEVPKPLRV